MAALGLVVALVGALGAAAALGAARWVRPGDDLGVGPSEVVEVELEREGPWSPPRGGGGEGATPGEQGQRARSLRFAALGDTGNGGEGQHAVAKALERVCAARGCDLVLLLGDNIYDDGPSSDDDPLFTSRFEQPYRGVMAPFYAVLGNHDCGGGGAGHRFERAAFEIAYTKRSPRWRMPGRYFRVRAGEVDLVGVDTNAQMFGRDAAMAQAVAKGLEASRATWKIAFGHHPYLSNGTHGDAGAYDGVPGVVPIAPGEGVKSFVEGAVCGRADVYLSGHDHSRQWLEATCGGTELVVSGAGASSTRLPGRHATRFQSPARGFVYVTIEGPVLRAEMIDEDGAIDFVRELRKSG